MQDDPKISIRHLANILKIRNKSIQKILQLKFGLKKIQWKWAPKTLTQFWKQLRVEFFKSVLAHFQVDKKGCLNQLVTQNESWFYHYIPWSNKKSRMWLKSKSQASKVPRSSPPVGKIMANRWWDTKGILMIKFFKSVQKLTEEDYIQQLRDLRQIINVQSNKKLTKEVIIF